MNNFFIGTLIAIALIAVFSPVPTFAQPSTGGNTLPTSQGFNTQRTASEYSVQNPLRAKSISQFVEQILEAVIIIGIPVGVLFLVLAGLKFVTAMGDTNKIKSARDNLLNTVIGIGLFLGAWTIAQVIYRTVTSLGGGSGGL